MIPTIEQHVNWIADGLSHLRDNNLVTMEAQESAEQQWVETVGRVAEKSLWGACDNWYTGSNVPGKPRVFMLYVDWVSYLETCEDVVADGYRGFALA